MAHKRQVRNERKGNVEITGDHPGMLLKLEAERVFDLAQNIISRYVHEEIDAAYIVYNEFKSVIAQRAGGGAVAADSTDWSSAD